MKYNKFLLVSLVAGLAGSAFAFDGSADWSLASNPNGVWSYGWSNTLLGPMTLDTATATSGVLQQWRGDLASDGNPSLVKNTSASTVASGTVTWAPNQLIMHPGPGGQFAILRFTAPTSSLYNIFAGFIGQDSTTTDVHIIQGGVSQYDNFVNGFGNSNSTTSTLYVTAGDTIDVRVGYGSNSNFNNDSTGVEFRVESVPEPMTISALALGALGLARRKKA